MPKFKSGLRWIVVLFIVFLVIPGVLYAATMLTVPNRVVLLEGEHYTWNVPGLLPLSAKTSERGILEIGSLPKSRLIATKNFNHISLITKKNGHTHLALKVFGIIPLKQVDVSVLKVQQVVACGKPVGIKLKTDGILVLGVSGFKGADGKKVNPAGNKGLKAGDLLIQVNGQSITETSILVRNVQKSGTNSMRIRVKRGNKTFDVQITPQKASEDGLYHLGLWVRDNVAGIGTMTFYLPQTGQFGGLGHGISDIDTGDLVPASSGEVVECCILAIQKGKAGSPGELKGIFSETGKPLGTVEKNEKTGIRGTLNEFGKQRMAGTTYPIGLRIHAHEGAAVILADLDGRGVRQYRIQIQSILRKRSSKGMALKITDDLLLNLTGGIVQGMSGCPIIQDGRIIGAVTHVLVNDPYRGYGVFLEDMLENVPINSQKPGIKVA